MAIKLVPVRVGKNCDPLVVEKMRELYNASIPEVATKPLQSKSSREQYEWWQTLDHENVIVSIYCPEEEPWEMAAFSIVRDRGEYCTPFFCTNPAYRGKGIGEQIIKHYLSVTNKPFRGEQLTSNGPIRHLNSRLGWTVVGTRDEGRVELLTNPGSSQVYPDYQAILDWIDSK